MLDFKMKFETILIHFRNDNFFSPILFCNFKLWQHCVHIITKICEVHFIIVLLLFFIFCFDTQVLAQQLAGESFGYILRMKCDTNIYTYIPAYAMYICI